MTGHKDIKSGNYFSQVDEELQKEVSIKTMKTFQNKMTNTGFNDEISNVVNLLG